MGARFSSKMSTGQAGMIGLIMPDQSLAQQQAQQARKTIICTCGGVWWQHPLRRLQAPTGLGMQLQKSARPDLRAGVVFARAENTSPPAQVPRMILPVRCADEAFSKTENLGIMTTENLRS